MSCVYAGLRSLRDGTSPTVWLADPAQHLDRWAPEPSSGPVMPVASRNATVRVKASHWIPEGAARESAVDIVHSQRW
jgi:hypothetical protein